MAEKKYLPMLDHPDQVDALYHLMLSDFAPLSSDTPHYDVMQEALRNVAAYQRGEYSLFTPLPEAVLQAERQAKQAAKEAKKAEQAQHTPPPPKEPEGKLAAAARALGKKMQPQAVEDDDGQISFDLLSTPAQEYDDSSTAEPAAPAVPQAGKQEASIPPPADKVPTIRELYEHYAPIIKNMVLADEAYQNACKNSDQPTARLEGDAAVKRAALTLGPEDTVFLRLYSDNTRFHNRLHREIVDETYPILSQHQREQTAPLSFPNADDSAAPQQAKRPGRTKPELNYRTLSKLFPESVSGECRYLKLEAGEGMMPLHLEWISEDEIAVGHTYVQNSDLMRDPEMTFRVDREKGTLEPLTFQQDGGIPIYQEVYPEPGKWVPKLRSDLNTFAQQWFKNISEQGYLKKEAIVERDGEDVRLAFGQEGNALSPVNHITHHPHSRPGTAVHPAPGMRPVPLPARADHPH